MSWSRMGAVVTIVFTGAGCASGAPADDDQHVVAGAQAIAGTGGLGGAGGQAGSAGAIGTGSAGSAGASGAGSGSAGGAGGAAAMAGRGGAGAGGSAGSARSGSGGSGSGGMDAGRGGAAGSAGAGGAAPDSSCDAATFEAHTYWFCTNNADWNEARAMCQGAGGDLVSIGSQAEQDFVTAQADGGIWLIGLDQKNASGSSSAGTWEWSDGSDLTAYANWRQGEPDDQECGALDGTGWVDRSCTNDTNYICEVSGP
jgi:Lectin C-type domain